MSRIAIKCPNIANVCQPNMHGSHCFLVMHHFFTLFLDFPKVSQFVKIASHFSCTDFKWNSSPAKFFKLATLYSAKMQLDTSFYMKQTFPKVQKQVYLDLESSLNSSQNLLRPCAPAIYRETGPQVPKLRFYHRKQAHQNIISLAPIVNPYQDF